MVGCTIIRKQRTALPNVPIEQLQVLGFPAELTGGEDYCFYSGSFFFFFFFFFILLSPLARKRG
jgi:hypothetical protein